MAKFLLILLTVLGALTDAHELTMNIVDSSQALELSHFDIDVASKRGKEVITSLLLDPNRISLDNHFAEKGSDADLNLDTTPKRISKVNSSLDFSIDLKNDSKHRRLVGEHGRQLWNTTQESQVCKQCIDNGYIWCPTSSKLSGYCCALTENCPRAGACSTDYQLLEFQYMLCPNEAGCTFDR